MKPFDLEKAKSGAKLCTRDGRRARIICYDRKSQVYPIVALIKDDIREEYIRFYTLYGESDINAKDNDDDLFIAPEKKEGWVNVYKDLAKYKVGGDYIYDTKEEAERQKSDTCIATVKIKWEEWEE